MAGKVQQRREQAGCEPPPRHPLGELLVQCAGNGLQLFWKSGTVQIDAHPQDHIFRGPRLQIQGCFGQDPADLPPIQQQVIDPFDGRLPAADLFDDPADLHGGRCGNAGALLCRQSRPQHQAEVYASLRRKKGTAPSPFPRRLPGGHNGGPFRRALGRQLFGPVVGGIHFAVYVQQPCIIACGQPGLQGAFGQHVAFRQQAIPPVVDRLDPMPLFFQLVDGFPYRSPGDPQLFRHLLPGPAVAPGVFQQR